MEGWGGRVGVVGRGGVGGGGMQGGGVTEGGQGRRCRFIHVGVACVSSAGFPQHVLTCYVILHLWISRPYHL